MNRTYTHPQLEEADVIDCGIPAWLKWLLLKLHLMHNYIITEGKDGVCITKTYWVDCNHKIKVPFHVKNPTHNQFAAEYAKIGNAVRELGIALGKDEQTCNTYEEVVRYKGDRYWAFFAVPK